MLTPILLQLQWSDRYVPASVSMAVVQMVWYQIGTRASATTQVFQLWPGGYLSIKMSPYQYRDPHVKDKTVARSRDRLIFNKGIPIPGKDRLYIETGPRDCCNIECPSETNLKFKSPKIPFWLFDVLFRSQPMTEDITYVTASLIGWNHSQVMRQKIESELRSTFYHSHHSIVHNILLYWAM